MIDAENEDSPTTWGQSVQWTERNGNKNSVAITGAKTLTDARVKVYDLMKRSGWTPARWWQWWRWKDTKVDLVEWFG
jgi:hypothetical protein